MQAPADAESTVAGARPDGRLYPFVDRRRDIGFKTPYQIPGILADQQHCLVHRPQKSLRFGVVRK